MPLAVYKKATIKEKIIERKERQKTIWDILDGIYEKVYLKSIKIRPIAFAIPTLLIISGLTIIWGQIKPYLIHFIEAKFSKKFDQGITTLVSEDYNKIRASYITDPGNEYFSQILENKKRDSYYVNFKGIFYLTIEKAEIFNAPVEANVDSTNSKIYQTALGKGLAHFKGTKLPGENGNILIYGHSSAGNYAERNKSDVVVAFTRLFKLSIGDKILINFANKNYNYIVKKIKEVEPYETNIIEDMDGNTLTLLTCSPPGLNKKRLVIIATEQ